MKIKKDIIEQIMEHGKKEAPLEACGYLAGKENLINKYYPMRNIDQSEKHFSLEPKEQFEVIKMARQENLKILAVCHTHPTSPARPSAEDIKLAYDPNMMYVIASLIGEQEIRAYRIVKGRVEEVEVFYE